MQRLLCIAIACNKMAQPLDIGDRNFEEFVTDSGGGGGGGALQPQQEQEQEQRVRDNLS